MDIATLVGVIVCFIMIIFGVVFDKTTGVNFALLGNFVDVQSLIITLGGAFCAVLAMNSL